MSKLNDYHFGPFRLDARLRRLFEGDRVIHLKPKEWELLHYLVDHSDRLVSKDELLEALWPRQTVTEANLTQTVYRVRQALGDSAKDARWIETLSRLGYRFIGQTREPGEEEPGPWPRSIAVLPFADEEAEAMPSDWSLGVAESLIRELSTVPSLEVRSLGAVIQLQSGQGVEAVAALGVDAVIDGSLAASANRLRVEASLREARSGRTKATWSWGLDATDAIAAQRRIAAEVKRDLRHPAGTDGDDSNRAATTERPETRAAYLRGRYCWQQFTASSLRQAIALFDKAIESTPRHAPSHAWRSAAWSALGNIGALTPRNSAELARRDADRAIAMDDSLADGFEMRGVVELYFDWNVEAALRSFDRAIERDPDSPNAHHLRGNALAFAGRFDAALQSLERALHLDPTSMITQTDAGVACYLAGRYAEAQAGLEAVLAQNPHFTHARLKLAFVLAAQGHGHEALKATDPLSETLEPMRFPERALFLGRAGHGREASEWLTAAIEQDRADGIDPYAVALAFVGVSDRAATLKWLRRAAEHRSRALVQLALDPIWNTLHEDPEFRKLVETVGLAPIPAS